MRLFDFTSNMGNHDERTVATYKENNLFVDTCRINDSDKPYETAIVHPDYNDNDLIIVELYDTIEEARDGHQRWVETMLHNPPQQIIDVSTAAAASLLRAIGELPAYEKQVTQ